MAGASSVSGTRGDIVFDSSRIAPHDPFPEGGVFEMIRELAGFAVSRKEVIVKRTYHDGVSVTSEGEVFLTVHFSSTMIRATVEFVARHDSPLDAVSIVEVMIQHGPAPCQDDITQVRVFDSGKLLTAETMFRRIDTMLSRSDAQPEPGAIMWWFGGEFSDTTHPPVVKVWPIAP